MPHAYSEDALVEQPAIELFAGLGWQSIGAFDEVFGAGGTLGRESAGDVVLLRHLVPKAAFIGFTGTPLMTSGEEKTKEVFGDYVSVYDFKQSVDDGATVPLFYENRIAKMRTIL